VGDDDDDGNDDDDDDDDDGGGGGGGQWCLLALYKLHPSFVTLISRLFHYFIQATDKYG